MLSIAKASSYLKSSNSQYKTLKSFFNEFANHIKKNIVLDSFPVKDISVDHDLEFNKIKINFNDKEIYLLFSVNFSNGVGVGNIKFLIKEEFPSDKLKPINTFNFDHNGTLQPNSDNETYYLNINTDVEAIQFLLNIIVSGIEA